MAEDKTTAEVKLPGACAVESGGAGEDGRTNEGGGGMEVGGAKVRMTNRKRNRRGSRKQVKCSENTDLEQAVDKSSSDFNEKDVEMPLPILVEPRSCSAAKTLRKEVLIRAATFNELDSKTLIVAREMCVREEAPQPVKKLIRNNTMPEICYQCLVSPERSTPTSSTSAAIPATSPSAEGRPGGRDSPLSRLSDVKKYDAVRTLRKDALIRAATFSSLDTRTLPVAKEKCLSEDNTTAYPAKKLVRNNTMPEICYHCLLAADITADAPSSSTPESSSCSTYVEESCGNMNHNTFLLSQSMVRPPAVTLSLSATPTPPPLPRRRLRSWASWREPYDHFDMRCFVNAFLLLVFGLVPWVVALITLLQDGNHVLAAGVAVSLLLLAFILVLQIAKRRRATSDLESQRPEVHTQQYLEAPPDYELLMAKPPPYEVLYEVHHCPTASGFSVSAEPSLPSPRLLHLYRTFRSDAGSSGARDSASGEAIDDDDDLPSYEFAMRYCNLLAPPTSSAD